MKKFKDMTREEFNQSMLEITENACKSLNNELGFRCQGTAELLNRIVQQAAGISAALMMTVLEIAGKSAHTEIMQHFQQIFDTNIKQITGEPENPASH